MASNETAPASPPAQSAAPRSTVGRGPSYPSIDVKEAIDRLQVFYNAERRNAAPIGAAARHWGYSEKSSSVRTVVAALVGYGLLEDTGSGDARTLKITGRGLDVLLDEDGSPKRLSAIQAALRTPKINAELLARHSPDDLPSDQTLRYYLLREKAFNDGAVDGYLKTLRDSIAFAKLDKPAIIPPKKVDPKEEKPDIEPPEVGDVVQWESAGVIQMEAPRRVRAKVEDQGAWWVFVEGSETGIPMDETVVVERKAPDPAAQKQPPVLPLPSVGPRVEQAAPGELEASRGKLGDGVAYRLLVTGEMGPKQIGKLIKLLEAQKAVLADDSEE